jgi:hypothetical protein
MSIVAAIATAGSEALDATDILNFIAKGISLAEQAAAGVSEAETITTLVKTIISENRDPTAAEMAQIDAAEATAYAAVQSA